MAIIRNNGQLQRRAVRSNGWTKKRRTIFLDALAATCNVRTSCAAAGMRPESARALRLRDGEFARLWAEAMAQGTERLEEELLAHALGQVPTGDNPVGDRAEPPPLPPFDPKLAMDVVKFRQAQESRTRAGPKAGALTQAEIDEALVKRLDALAKRLGNTEGAA